MQAGVQEELPSGAHGEAMHRGYSQRQDRHHFRRAMHWVRYLCQGSFYYLIYMFFVIVDFPHSVCGVHYVK